MTDKFVGARALLRKQRSSLDELAAQMTAIYAAKKYTHEQLWAAMLERPEPVFEDAWLTAYVDQVLVPRFKL